MKFLVLSLLVASALAAPSGKPHFKRGLNKIIGGEDVSPGEVPWTVSFQEVTYGIYHFCGGSVYSETWIITAAHCVNDQNFDNPRDLEIVAGDCTIFSHTDDSTGQTAEVIKIIQHEDFDRHTFYNDIALLKLGSSLTFDSYVSPIALPASQDQDDKGDATISGWGYTYEGGWINDALQKVTVPIVSDDDCRVSYGDPYIADSMICAGIDAGGKDSCNGDSGGPMVCDFGTENVYLCGIVSWGLGCAHPHYPGVYTQVSYFKDWILTNTA